MAVSGTLDKKADLAGPGIGTYEDLEKLLPNDYRPLLGKKETQQAITAVKKTFHAIALWRAPVLLNCSIQAASLLPNLHWTAVMAKMARNSIQAIALA